MLLRGAGRPSNRSLVVGHGSEVWYTYTELSCQVPDKRK
jgi:hypothetical protein